MTAEINEDTVFAHVAKLCALPDEVGNAISRDCFYSDTADTVIASGLLTGDSEADVQAVLETLTERGYGHAEP